MGKVLQFLLIFVAQVPDDGLMTAVEGADALLECKVSGEDVVPSEEINGTGKKHALEIQDQFIVSNFLTVFQAKYYGLNSIFDTF